MSNNRHVILNYVDSPLKILLWTTGEIMLFIFPMIFGLIFDQLTLGIVTCVVNYMINNKYKKRFGKGQLQAVAYWFLPSGWSVKKFPASHIREYLG